MASTELRWFRGTLQYRNLKYRVVASGVAVPDGYTDWKTVEHVDEMNYNF